VPELGGKQKENKPCVRCEADWKEHRWKCRWKHGHGHGEQDGGSQQPDLGVSRTRRVGDKETEVEDR
jgi:hypothetical protein